MAFSPISLPIQEILLSNFIPDIATITNANDLIFQDTIENLINNFEIDLNALSIGTTNAIASVKANTVILQDTGFIFQTGVPNQILSTLTKNGSTESVFMVDRITANKSITVDVATINTATVNTAATFAGPATFNSSIKYTQSLIESKQAITTTLAKNGTTAEARITLTKTSTKNIFVTLSATTAPTANPVYDGVSAIDPTITKIVLYIDFDATNPPAQNTPFTIYLADIVQSTGASIFPAVISGLIPFVIRGGVNNNTTNAVYLHNSPDPNGYDIGININGTNTMLNSVTPSPYNSNLSMFYILDSTSKDRLVVTGMTGLEFFHL